MVIWSLPNSVFYIQGALWSQGQPSPVVRPTLCVEPSPPKAQKEHGGPENHKGRTRIFHSLNHKIIQLVFKTLLFFKENFERLYTSPSKNKNLHLE